MMPTGTYVADRQETLVATWRGERGKRTADAVIATARRYLDDRRVPGVDTVDAAVRESDRGDTPQYHLVLHGAPERAEEFVYDVVDAVNEEPWWRVHRRLGEAW